MHARDASMHAYYAYMQHTRMAASLNPALTLLTLTPNVPARRIPKPCPNPTKPFVFITFL